MKKLIQIVIATILAILCLSAADAAVNYPVISPNLRAQITQAQEADIFVGGEWTELWQGDRLAIAVPYSPNGGYLLEVQFLDMPGLPGYRKPVLSTTVLSIHPAQDVGYYQFADGTKEYYGSNSNLNGVKTFIYAWSWYDNLGYERWSVTVTYGDGADIYEPGMEIDRAQFGTIPGEPRELGFQTVAMEMAGTQPVIGIFVDAEAEFILEGSTDLRSWHPLESTVEAVPDSETSYGGVDFRGGLVYPTAPTPQGFGTKHFFRLKKKA